MDTTCPRCYPFPAKTRPLFAARISVVGLLLCLLLACPASPASPVDGDEPVAKVGYLLLSPLSETPSPERQALLDRLAELGYRDGENLEILYRSADWDRTRLLEHALDLANRDVELIITVSADAARAAKRVTRTVPILFVPAAEPLAAGLVNDLAQPDGNLSGVSLNAPRLAGKRLDLLKEAYPHIRRVAVLSGNRKNESTSRRRATEAAGLELGLELTFYQVDTVHRMAQTLATMERSPPDALLSFNDSRTLSYRKLLANFGLEHQIPTMAASRAFVDAGGLLSYGPSLPALFGVIGDYSAHILDGLDPGQLPVFLPMSYQLLINLNTARELGRPIGSSVLFRADEVVE